MDGSPPRRGRLSAFSLLKSWLFSKRDALPSKHETEFLNTRDGYELARFAQQAFGNEEQARQAQQQAIEAEQAAINALLQGRGAAQPVGARHAPGPVMAPLVRAAAADPPAGPPGMARAAAAAAVAPPPDAADAHADAHADARADAPSDESTGVDAAVLRVEALRAQGFSVETLAEALIIVESADVRARQAAGAR